MKTENNILEKIGNKNPYKVPENYFEDFANNMDKILDAMPLPEGMVAEEASETAEIKPTVETPLHWASSLNGPLISPFAMRPECLS